MKLSGLNKAHPLEGIVAGLISRMGKGARPTAEEIQKAWEMAAGRKAARHSRPVALKKTQLVVNVADSCWLYELTTRKLIILKRLNGRLKGRKINQIRLRIGELST